MPGVTGMYAHRTFSTVTFLSSSMVSMMYSPNLGSWRMVTADPASNTTLPFSMWYRITSLLSAPCRSMLNVSKT